MEADLKQVIVLGVPPPLTSQSESLAHHHGPILRTRLGEFISRRIKVLQVHPDLIACDLLTFSTVKSRTSYLESHGMRRGSYLSQAAFFGGLHIALEPT